MDAKEYLRRLQEAPETLTIDDRIEYLKNAYYRDGLSRDTRRQVYAEIKALEKKKKKNG